MKVCIYLLYPPEYHGSRDVERLIQCFTNAGFEVYDSFKKEGCSVDDSFKAIKSSDAVVCVYLEPSSRCMAEMMFAKLKAKKPVFVLTTESLMEKDTWLDWVSEDIFEVTDIEELITALDKFRHEVILQY